MGSQSDLYFNDYPVLSLRNSIDTWVFYESDKKIVKRNLSDRNSMIWGEPDIGDNIEKESEVSEEEENKEDEFEDAFLIEAEASTIIQRLELKGFSLEHSKRHFDDNLKEMIEYLGELIADEEYEYNHERVKLFDFLKTNQDFFKWQNALSEIISKKLPTVSCFSDKTAEYGDDIINFILSPPSIWLDDCFPFNLNIPSNDFDCYARIILSACPEDCLVVIDATDVIQSGYSDEFHHHEVLGGKNSNFHSIAIENFNDIKEIINSFEKIGAPDILPRILFANAITVFEAYLSDTIIYFITNFEALIRKFVESDEEFSSRRKKISLSEIFKVRDGLSEDVRSHIQQLTYHNLKKTKLLYKNLLGIELPSNTSKIESKVNIRHDIIHRNGRNLKGIIHNIKVKDVLELINEIEETVNEIDTEVTKLYPDIVDS